MSKNLGILEKLSEQNREQLEKFKKQLDEYENSPLIVDELPPISWITNKGHIISISKKNGKESRSTNGQ